MRPAITKPQGIMLMPRMDTMFLRLIMQKKRQNITPSNMETTISRLTEWSSPGVHRDSLISLEIAR